MTDDKPTTRRDLMRPVQLLGLAFGSALFAGIVTAVSMGLFQQRFDGQGERALVVAGVVAGITFIVVLVGLALMILAVDPAQVTKQVDRPVLLPEDEPGPGAATNPPVGTGGASGAGPDAAADPDAGAGRGTGAGPDAGASDSAEPQPPTS